MGRAAYQLYDEFDYAGADKNNLSDVLDRFEAYFRPQHNMIHVWYRIGTTFSNSDGITSQSKFMYRLKDLAQQCEFTNSDEIVKFLFLIYNKHSNVRQELLKHVQKETTLNQCLEYAHSVEGNLQLVELSRYIDKMPQSNYPNNAEIHALDKKKFKQKCCDVTPAN